MFQNKKWLIGYKVAVTITIIFFFQYAKAQTTDSVRIAINNILAPLNKTLIPTGILAENTYPLIGKLSFLL